MVSISRLNMNNFVAVWVKVTDWKLNKWFIEKIERKFEWYCTCGIFSLKEPQYLLLPNKSQPVHFLKSTKVPEQIPIKDNLTKVAVEKSADGSGFLSPGSDSGSTRGSWLRKCNVINITTSMVNSHSSYGSELTIAYTKSISMGLILLRMLLWSCRMSSWPA